LSRLLKYRAETEKFFKDYLPDEMFIKFSSENRILFRKYRENNKIIESKEYEILILQNQIKTHSKQIKKLQNQIGSPNKKSSFNGKMISARNKLLKVSNDYKFNLSVGIRYHNYKIKDEKNSKFYLRVTAYNKKFKNIYIGGDNKVKALLKEIHYSSFDEFNKIQLKSELSLLYSVYTRNFIWNNSWEVFFESKHNTENLIKWAKELGNEIYRW
tara:strand:+ start:218 stop:859 length:642 start_codon:yes stop_codon:yes gene_type:complete